MKPIYRKWTYTAVRLILGILLLASGIGKLIDSSDALYMVELVATQIYWLIEYAKPVIIILSVVEILIGSLLLADRYVRPALITSMLLFLFFIGVLGFFVLEGMNVESCGCFGAFGLGSGIEVTLARNVVLIGIAAGGLFISSGREAPEEESGGNISQEEPENESTAPWSQR